MILSTATKSDSGLDSWTAFSSCARFSLPIQTLPQSLRRWPPTTPPPTSSYAAVGPSLPTPAHPLSTSGPLSQLQPQLWRASLPTPPTHPQLICFLSPSISFVPVPPPQPHRPDLPLEPFLLSIGPSTPLRPLFPSTGHSSPPLRQRHQCSTSTTGHQFIFVAYGLQLSG
jgi:hypothetical protein